MLQRVLSCLFCVFSVHFLNTFILSYFCTNFSILYAVLFILQFVKRKKWAEAGSGDLLLYIFCICLVTCAVFVLCWNGQDDCVLHIV